MAACGNEEGGLDDAGQKHRHDDGDVGQMRAPGIRRVDGEGVAWRHVCFVLVEDGADAVAHGAQMHRHVRGVSNEIAGCIKDGAGKIKTLLDVHRRRGLFERNAHLFRNGHKQGVENLQADGISCR